MNTYALTARSGVRNGLAAAVYIMVVAFFMSHGEALMRDKPNVLNAVFMLLLFVVSALITGSLALWQPAKLLVDGKKQEAGILLCVTGGTLVIVLVLVLIALLLR